MNSNNFNQKILLKHPLKIFNLRASPFLGSPERLILGRLKVMNQKKCIYLTGIFDEQKGDQNEFYSSIKAKKNKAYLFESSMWYFIKNISTMTKIFRAVNFSIICTHDYKSNFYGLFLSRLIGTPAIAVIHGYTSTDFKIKYYQMLDLFLLKFFDCIICVSESSRKKIKRWIPYNSSWVIPNAVDIKNKIGVIDAKTQLEVDLLNKKFRFVVFAGRLSKEKGLNYLISAAEIVLKKNQTIKFLMLGDGPEKLSLTKMISERKLSNSIYLLGFKKNISLYIEKSEFLVLPSLSEGMPVIILEAFALQKPVIASNVGGIPEIVESSRTGLLIPPRDEKALAHAIEEFLSNPEMVSEMGRNAFSFVKSEHNFGSQIQKYLHVYENTLEKRKCK